MSEITERDDFAQNSITRVLPGLPFQDNNIADPYYGYNRQSATNQVYGDYLSIGQHDIQPSYQGFSSPSFANGQERLQQFHQPLQSHLGQDALQRSIFFPQGDMQNVQDYGLRYSPFEQYSDSNGASPILHYLPQIGTHWDDRLHYEGDLNQRSLFNGNVTLPVATQAQTVVAQTDEVYKNEPYAKLIFLALRSAPGHKMALKDIYEWFERFTDKTQPGSKGWQNSIRHNLSMNIVSNSRSFRMRTNRLQAFQKEESERGSGESKRNYVWSLSNEALRNGFVESTTRFRKPVKKTSVAQPSHRVSKRSRATVAQPTLSQRYLLPPYDHLSNDMDQTEQQYDVEEQQAFQPLGSAWSHQVSPYALPQPTFQQQSYEQFPNHYLRFLPMNDNEAGAGRALNNVQNEIAASFPQPLEDGREEKARPFELAGEGEDSPTPSMTTTDSSFGYHEMTDEEQYHLHHSSDFHFLPSGDQSYYKPRMSAPNSYATR